MDAVQITDDAIIGLLTRMLCFKQENGSVTLAQFFIRFLVEKLILIDPVCRNLSFARLQHPVDSVFSDQVKNA